MKKYIYAFIATVCLPFSTQAQVAINETNFPDPNFRAVVETFDDGDGVLSADEIAAATTDSRVPNKLDLSKKGIANLDGLEYFTSTKVLNCSRNNLTSLDVSSLTNLTSLTCGDNSTQEKNRIESLDISDLTNLKLLQCYNVGLKSIDLTYNTKLENVYIANNFIESLNLENLPNLADLVCYRNPITSLDVSNNKKLEQLQCQSCKLTELDVTSNTKLWRLECNNNNISVLDVSNMSDHRINRTKIFCQNNPIRSLDVSKLAGLKSLNCSYCELTTLDLTNNPDLDNLHCTSNHLTTLDLSQNTKLTTIDVDGQEVETDAIVLDRDKIAIEITPSINLADITTDMFKNLGNGKENTFTFTDGDQQYINYEDWKQHFLVIAKPKTDETGKDIDLRNQVVKYEFDVQNPKDEDATMSVTVNIPYPYIMFVNPLTKTISEEVDDPTQGGEPFYSGTIYLDYDSYVGNFYLDYDTWLGYEAYLYAATGIEESNLKDMLHGGQNPTPKQIVLQKSDLSDILPSETPAYVKTPLPGYYAFNRFVEPEMVPQVKQVRKAPRKKYSYYDELIERAAENFEDNLFQGTLTDLSVDYQAVLTLGREKGIPTGVVGFWRYRGEKVAAHRAYLPADLLTNDGGDVKGFVLNFNNNATGIRQIESNEESGAWYNLQGVQMAAPTQKGIYIRNGKKLIVR